MKKKIENVFELIDELPPDMKEEVFTKLMSFNPSNSKNLSLINKELADCYSRTRKLGKITSPVNLKIEKMPKITSQVVGVIGDLKIEKILKYSPVVQKLDNIVNDIKYDNLLFDEDDFSYFSEYNNLADAKRQYEINTNKTDFNKKKQDYIEIWNFMNSGLKSNPIEGIKNFQSRIKKSRKQIAAYDPENVKADNEKIDSFLKITANNTYDEYIKTLRDLPLSVKALDI